MLRSIRIDFREAHRFHKVLPTLTNRPDSACGAVAPPCQGGELLVPVKNRFSVQKMHGKLRGMRIPNRSASVIRTRVVYDRPIF